MIHFIRPKEQMSTPLSPPPKMVEILGIYVITFSLTFLFFLLSARIIPDNYGPLISISSHIPLFAVPWLWFHFRVHPRVKNAIMWRWTKGSFVPLLLVCSWLIPLQIIGNLDVLGKPLPDWYQNGAGSIWAQILFQGLVVGFSEEMFMRPVLHQTLLSKNMGGFRLFNKFTLSTPLLITALLFALLHVGNIGHQPIGYTMMQIVYAFVIGVIFGVYYEKTRNYVGTAILHNLVDCVGVAIVLIVVLIS